VSPPSWERAQCQVRIGGAGLTTQSPPLSQVSDVATTFVESDQQDEQSAQTVQMATVELSGQLVGDIGQTLSQLDAQLGAASVVTVSCQKLIRVDFVAAGDLLNWVLGKRGESRTVTFADAHRLVALFFGAMGRRAGLTLHGWNLLSTAPRSCRCGATAWWRSAATGR
jgi:ABC-type transporter Mla MlaB component